jgi:butyrate kinase
MPFTILVINPGSTSTKIAVFQDTTPIFQETLRHSAQELAPYVHILDQYQFRKAAIAAILAQHQIALTILDAVVGRGGLVHPLEGGCYRVNDLMLADLRAMVMGEHASNLGALIAKALADEIGKPAFIVDPVVVDEMEPLARYSGLPDLPRRSIFHALNQKAVARRVAKELGTPYSACCLIVAHLGGGISVGAHQYGRVIDVNNALDGDGPFSPERSGGLPVGQLATLCFSGQYPLETIKKMITGKGGFMAYLGTNAGLDVKERIQRGDAQAREVYEAMAYQVAKEIGALATVLKGRIDAIVLTGGLACDTQLVDWIVERVSFLAPVKVVPGEDEMIALCEGVLPVLRGEEMAKEYMGKQ